MPLHPTLFGPVSFVKVINPNIRIQISLDKPRRHRFLVRLTDRYHRFTLIVQSRSRKTV